MIKLTTMVLMISELHEKPIAYWRGKERFEDSIIECLTIIFRTSGCSWNRCLMCGYRHERSPFGESKDSKERHLLSQLAWVLDRYKNDNYQMVKIFTSGSFFDPEEIPPSVLEKVALEFQGKLIIAETRPEFIIEDTITYFVKTIDNGTWKTPLYCAIGLETSDDKIRDKSIKKGFLFSDFVDACARTRSCGAGIKAYLLMKPLFLTEREAINDMKSSIKDVLSYTDLISMNPCTVQSKTDLEYYWKQGAYRPPYLWSILEVLRKIPVPITCDSIGGGKKRGAHNCGKCDPVIVSGIHDYSLSADRELIASLFEMECSCKEEWNYVIDQEMPFCMPLTR
jgi:radical SAM enzyme (TIGR01210 family)